MASTGIPDPDPARGWELGIGSPSDDNTIGILRIGNCHPSLSREFGEPYPIMTRGPFLLVILG